MSGQASSRVGAVPDERTRLRPAGAAPWSGWHAIERALRVILPEAEQQPPVHYTPWLAVVVGTCVAAAAVLAAWLCRPVANWFALGVIATVILVISRTSIRSVTGVEHVFSATILLHLGMTFVLGPAAALAAAVAEAAGAALRVRNGWFRVSFNVSNLFLSDVAAWKVFETAGGGAGSPAWRLALGGGVAGLTQWFLNHALLLAVFIAMQGRRARPLPFLRSAAVFLPYSCVYGFAAAAFPILFAAQGTLGVLMLVGPIGAAQAFLVLLERQVRIREKERATHIESLEASTHRIEVAHSSTLIALTNALDARDRETEGHSRRVVEYSREIGIALGLDAHALHVLSQGALLHDIGKIGIPDHILLKPDRLTEQEWEVMRLHPRLGARMIEEVEAMREARRLILHHHEHWDGTGYPSGLRGTEIIRGARLFAVADAVDAMTQDRPYRRSLGWERALSEVREGRGRQFDPEAVDALLSLPEARLFEIAAMRRPPRLDLLVSPHEVA